MPIVKLPGDALRRRARVDAARKAATSEEDIARHAREDDSSTDSLDFKSALGSGRMRVLRPFDVAAIRAKTGLSQDRFARRSASAPTRCAIGSRAVACREGPARALPMAIDRDPQAVMRALKG